jgi:hypothetical protein
MIWLRIFLVVCMNKQDSKEDTKKRGGKRERNRKEMEEDEAPKGYIHVRARRGQATDSHSLAERVLYPANSPCVVACVT